MKPVRILIEDFMGHRHTDIDCTQFQSILIVGTVDKNPRKSNGSGKTTIFNAIEYVLFGEVPDLKLDKLVRAGTDRCRVSFDFLSGGETYRTVRSRARKSGRSDLQLFQKSGDDWISLVQKTSSETENELAKLIKISHVAFRTSVLFAQADLYGLPSVKPKQRRALLKEPLQISIYNKYEKVAKEKASYSSKNLQRIKILLGALGNPETDIEGLENSIKENGLTIASLQEEINQSKSNLDALLLKKSKFHINEDDFTSLTTEFQALNNSINSIKDKISTLTKTIELDRTKFLKSEKEIELTKSSIQTLENNLIQLNSPDAISFRSLEEINEDIVKLSKKEFDGSVYLSKLSDELKKLKLPIPEMDVCNQCLQPVTKEHRFRCEEKRISSLEELTNNYKKYSILLKTIQEKLAQTKKELLEVQNHGNRVIDITNKLSTKKTELVQFVKFSDQLRETISSKENECKSKITSLSEMAEKATKLSERIKLSSDVENKKILENLKREIRDANSLYEEKTNKFNDLKVNTGVLSEKLQQRKTDLSKIEAFKTELKEAEKDYAMRLKVQHAFSSAGIPTLIINTVIDDLQTLANEQLNQLRPGIEVLFSVTKTDSDGVQEDTLEMSYRVDGVEYDYPQLSGAQKVMIALSLKFAMSLIIQRRIGVDINFLELDEVDSQFDEEALDTFTDIIKKWQNEFTIFVVTHNKYLKHKFNQAILVESDGNGSCGRLVSSW